MKSSLFLLCECMRTRVLASIFMAARTLLIYPCQAG